MSSVNKIILLGNVGQEPITKAFDNGDTVTSFSLATSDQWTDKNGEKRESTEWHNCVCYRQLSKIASDYVKKGSKVFVEGRLKTKNWEKDGVKHYRTDVEVLKLLVLDKKSSVEQSTTSDSDFPF
jgi:single-strand DNA-binding protein